MIHDRAYQPWILNGGAFVASKMWEYGMAWYPGNQKYNFTCKKLAFLVLEIRTQEAETSKTLGTVEEILYKSYTPWKINLFHIIIEVRKIIFPSKWVICMFQRLIFQGVLPCPSWIASSPIFPTQNFTSKVRVVVVSKVIATHPASVFWGKEGSDSSLVGG